MNTTKTLYSLAANKEYDELFAYLRSRESLTDYERAIGCLAYSCLSDVRRYKDWLSKFPPGKKRLEVDQVLHEAEIVDYLRHKVPKSDILKQINELLEQKEDAIYAKCFLAQYEFLDGNYAKAIVMFEQLKSIYPSAHWLNWIIAQRFLSIRNYKEALTYVKKLPNPFQRLAYSWLASFLLPKTAIAVLSGLFLVLLILLPQTLMFLLGMLIFSLFILAGIYFLRIRDRFLERLSFYYSLYVAISVLVIYLIRQM
jgi:tetratricopeptide (TPR) repeat protein